MISGKITTLETRAKELANDNDTLLYIIVSLCIVIVVIELLFRVYSAYYWQQQRRHVKCDDVAFFAAALLALCQFGLVIVQVKHGWGRRHIWVWGGNIILHDGIVDKTAYASDLFYVSNLACSKICALLFNRGIFRYVKRLSEWMVYGILLICGAAWIVSFVLLAVRCTSSPWTDLNQQCPSLFSHWQIVTALDIVTEIVIISYPIVCLHKVQMSHRQKFRVLVAMNCRILLIPLSALHLHFFRTQYVSEDPSADGIFSTSMAEIHILFSLVVLIGSSVKGLVSINNRNLDFVASLPPERPSVTTRPAISRPRLHHPPSIRSMSSAISSDEIENPDPVPLEQPQAPPYARKPPSRSHETWPRWSVIEEEEEEPATHVENKDGRSVKDLPVQLRQPPAPLLRRDHQPIYFGQSVINPAAGGEFDVTTSFGFI